MSSSHSDDFMLREGLEINKTTILVKLISVTLIFLQRDSRSTSMHPLYSVLAVLVLREVVKVENQLTLTL